jgi:SAM-dependent methyltransferase
MTHEPDRSTPAALLRLMAEIVDPITYRAVYASNVPTGGRCLVLGAFGSVARTLAARVGPSGEVIAAAEPETIDVSGYHNIRAIEHDVSVDELPGGRFDVICARLLLVRMPNRRRIVAQLADALTPGGMLLVEEWGEEGLARLAVAPDVDAEELFDRWQQCLLAVLRSFGVDTSWAGRVADAMYAGGLEKVETVRFARSWAGGTAGCQLAITTSMLLQTQLLARGISEAELARLQRILTDPVTLLDAPLTWSTIGRCSG